MRKHVVVVVAVVFVVVVVLFDDDDDYDQGAFVCAMLAPMIAI